MPTKSPHSDAFGGPPKRFRIFYLIVFLAGLVVLNYQLRNTFAFPTGDASIVYHAGLLMVLIGNYWVEHYFTKPADVVINCIVVFISISTLASPPLEDYWTYLRYFALVNAVVGFGIIWIGNPAIPKHDTSATKRVIYAINTRLGSAKVIFSLVFVLGLISYFDLRSSEVKILLVFWTLLLVAKHLDVDQLFRELARLFTREDRGLVGTVTRIVDPNVIRFEVLEQRQCPRGQLVAFTSAGILINDSPLAIVIGHRPAPSMIEAEAVMIDSSFIEGGLDRRHAVVAVDPADDRVKERLEANALYKDVGRLIGFAHQDTDIGRLVFEVVRKPNIEEGHLVAATERGREVLFQIVNGRLAVEASVDGSDRSFTKGDAQQLGTWNPQQAGFEAVGWVVPENAPVVHATERQPTLPPAETLASLHQVGTIPNSPFPAFVNVDDLVLYHSAILGVTGSGKTYLALSLIDACANNGIKVICLDPTGDYKRHLAGAVMLASRNDINPFLSQNHHGIGIVEFSERTHPITATAAIADAAFTWAEGNRTEEDLLQPRPKVLLVLEEAHTLVPEWTFNPDRGLQDTVNKTSQVALQARKYGLGFMVITQRTANVTKSLLNQCNTLAGFQAYDETGFDFMKNYMGASYVQALPNLKKRHAVLVGKASPSDRPLIVKLHDQERTLVDTAPLNFSELRNAGAGDGVITA
jgi:uncharacterized protein